jgi:hypothetical protein
MLRYVVWIPSSSATSTWRMPRSIKATLSAVILGMIAWEQDYLQFKRLSTIISNYFTVAANLNPAATYSATVQLFMSWTEDTLRKRMRVIIGHGVTQRALADRLLVSETWLTRWLNPGKINPATGETYKVRPITVPEMNRFEDYVRAFAKDLEMNEPKETQRENHTSTAGSLQRSTGTDGQDRRLREGRIGNRHPPDGPPRRTET